jgi:hypothetical protein
MTGGLMQLVGKGAQDHLVTGNPSFTNFRSVYKRHTDFAMEHFQLFFKTTNINLPQSGSLTLRAKIDRYAQLLHDCYLHVVLPDIYSPVSPITPGANSNINPNATAIGYEFQWVKNIGYNMIERVSILINGQAVVTHTGEWMKLYSNLKMDANKQEILDRMVGNIPELYDPGNAYDRVNQYPHSISSSTAYASPSIPGRVLHIPLHFWFCENVGAALPLIALQYSEVEIVVELRNIYQLFTTLDVENGSPTFGTRLAPNSSNTLYTINRFLSPPLYNNPTAPIQVLNPTLTTWKLNPYLEANFIFLTEPELIHMAKTEHSYIINQVDMVSAMGQYGPSNDLELTMKNLCTRIVWVAQRNDRTLNNDYDNYTNWVDPNKPPLDSTALQFMTPWYSSGIAQNSGVSEQNVTLESTLILDGKERFKPKTTTFFSELQPYKHHTGKALTSIPGIYSYSFALDNHTTQPSGHLNGSMFNKTILRNTYVQPEFSTPTNITTQCILKSTAGNPNPTVVTNPNAVDAQTGKLLYSPDELITIVNKGTSQTFTYTYNVHAYVESYNFLRVLGGVANVVFSS